MEVLDLFSVQASMCIYIRRPPLVGGHQAAKESVAITVPAVVGYPVSSCMLASLVA